MSPASYLTAPPRVATTIVSIARSFFEVVERDQPDVSCGEPPADIGIAEARNLQSSLGGVAREALVHVAGMTRDLGHPVLKKSEDPVEGFRCDQLRPPLSPI